MAAGLTDSATLSLGLNPTGTITFYLFAPGSTSSTPLSSAVYTATVPVSHGDGTYDISQATSTTGSNVPTTTGTYQWEAIYSSDNNNSSASSPFGTEPEDAVSARIAITPNAVNAVGTAETFTITVTATPSATTPSFGTPTISYSHQPDLLAPISATFVSQTSNVATYSVTINSDQVGTFVITATDMVTFTDSRGKQVIDTVTTNGSGGNSGPATKNYVNATIAITPNAVNAVGTSETFTVTVTVLTPATTAGQAITFSFGTPTIS